MNDRVAGIFKFIVMVIVDEGTFLYTITYSTAISHTTEAVTEIHLACERAIA